MPTPPLSTLPRRERQRLLYDLNYLNLSEIKAFCSRHDIPYSMLVETNEGKIRKSGEDDRKGVILGRVRHFLQTGKVLPPTIIPARATSDKPLAAKLTPGDRLYYGQYDKQSRAMLAVLGVLTKGRFRNGAVARILAREFWSRGTAPTFKEFASAWVRASEAHTKPNPEWAFLSDLASKSTGSDWKAKRMTIADRVLRTLDRISGDASGPRR